MNELIMPHNAGVKRVLENMKEVLALYKNVTGNYRPLLDGERYLANHSSFCFEVFEPTHYIVLMSLNDALSLSPSIVRSLLSFWLVILAYICVVTMFVCPNTRLTLSMGIPFESANVANECRPQ